MRTLLVAILFFTAHFAHAQNVEWAMYGKNLMDNYSNNIIATDSENNVYVLGTSLYQFVELYTSVIEDFEFFGIGNYVLKMSPEGEILWVQTINGVILQDHSTPWSLTVDNDDNLFVAGTFANHLVIGENSDYIQLNTGNFSRDGFVAKFSPQGTPLAAYYLGTTGSDKITAIAIAENNDIILGGNFKGEVDFGLKENPEIVDCDGAMLLRYSSDFDFISAQPLNYKVITQIKSSEDGHFFLSGYGAGPIADQNDNIICPNGNCAYFIKLNAENETVWGAGINVISEFLNPFTNRLLRDFKIGASGEIYLTGDARVTVNFYTKNGMDTFTNNTNEYHAFLLRIDASGNKEWIKRLNPEGSTQTSTSIAINGNNEIYVGGQYSDSTFLYSYGVNEHYFYRSIISKYTPSGNLENSVTFSSPINFDNGITGMASGTGDILYTLGYFDTSIQFNTEQPDNTISLFNSHNHYYLAKMGSFPVNTPFAEKPNPFIIYPNPTHNEVNIKGAGLKKIEIFDLSGKLLKTEITQGSDENYILKNHHLAPGVYMVRLSANGGSRTTQKLVVSQ